MYVSPYIYTYICMQIPCTKYIIILYVYILIYTKRSYIDNIDKSLFIYINVDKDTSWNYTPNLG